VFIQVDNILRFHSIFIALTSIDMLIYDTKTKDKIYTSRKFNNETQGDSEFQIEHNQHKNVVFYYLLHLL
jgi:hypothetical protein